MAKLDPYEKTERRQDIDAERKAQQKRRSQEQEKARREWQDEHGGREAEIPREPDGSPAPTPEPYGPPSTNPGVPHETPDIDETPDSGTKAPASKDGGKK